MEEQAAGLEDTDSHNENCRELYLYVLVLMPVEFREGRNRHNFDLFSFLFPFLGSRLLFKLILSVLGTLPACCSSFYLRSASGSPLLWVNLRVFLFVCITLSGEAN